MKCFPLTYVTAWMGVVVVFTLVSCGNPPPLPTRDDVLGKQPVHPGSQDEKGLLASVASGMFNSAQAKTLAWVYDDFFRAAKLEPAKEQRVRAIIVENAAATMHVVGKAALQLGDPEREAKAMDEAELAAAARDKKLAEVLSVEELGRLKEYERSDKVTARLTPERLMELFPGLAKTK